MYIPRTIEPILKEHLFKGKVVILYGARQTGKTTLLKKIMSDLPGKTMSYINCDEGDVRHKLDNADTSTKLLSVVGDSQMVFIDEAQKIKNVGLKLKLLVDNFPAQQFIATGSSAFELSEEIAEPLTGRSFEFWLYPFSLRELVSFQGETEVSRSLENIMIYGSYPGVTDEVSQENKKAVISNIAQNYLYKDILKFGNLKSSEIVQNLLRALALQIGYEVSYAEVGRLINVSKVTVANYVELLEKAYIIFKLPPLSRNLRKEIGSSRKIYFYDLGIRNSLINNQNSLAFRNDIGALWENLMVAEKKKQENFIGNKLSLYFWRTYDQQEIDLVEDKGGMLSAFEFKYSPKTVKIPTGWKKAYPEAKFSTFNKENYLDFVLKG